MNDEDVAIDGDGSDGEEGEAHIDVPEEREEDAQSVSMDPLMVDEPGGREGEVDATEDEVGHTQAYDESCSSTTNSRAANQGDNGQGITGQANYNDENDAKGGKIQ
ncbi:hypothetical protein TNIN_406631 [Trichonephila inaurata madagascariensis]|uniref:Uncharacterized protein n=1 Tax=Trichonephila inaurata madagascariensis TaxID=2747483 RepID=A0A8X7C526_9ARAC|nr:hypothetical protein TNIN_406631 [Trichonephila inaurata madagascariensis]